MLPQVKKQITNQVKQILPKQAGKFNQAMMELGETICIPKGNMKCNECPIKEYCQAYSKQLTNVIPFRNPKVKKKTEEKTVCLLYYQRKMINKLKIKRTTKTDSQGKKHLYLKKDNTV